VTNRHSHRRSRQRPSFDDLAGLAIPLEELMPSPRKAVPKPGTLQRIEFPHSLDETEIDPATKSLISKAQERIQAFQDRWDQPQIEQFVASDYELVYQALRWVVSERLMMGNRMLEWGCGFAVVAALGSRLGLDVFGVESEKRLLEQARKTLADFDTPVDLICGNFLPAGSESLSHNPDFPSLGHEVENAYELIGLDLDDFAFVFGYPWPGEELFHQAVFERYGATGGLLMLFCGPNDLRLWRKVK
jgi:hypothetical protein